MEKKGFTFWQSYYDAYKAAETLGKGDEYLHALLSYAFEGEEPETDDPFLSAFYSAALPTIKSSIRNVRNGQKSGSKPTLETHSPKTTERKGTERNRSKQKRKNISIVDITPSFDGEMFKEKAQEPIEYKRKGG